MRIKDLDKPNLIKLAYGGLILGLSWFSLLHQLPQKLLLDSKVVKSDSKIILSLHWSLRTWQVLVEPCPGPMLSKVPFPLPNLRSWFSAAKNVSRHFSAFPIAKVSRPILHQSKRSGVAWNSYKKLPIIFSAVLTVVRPPKLLLVIKSLGYSAFRSYFWTKQVPS